MGELKNQYVTIKRKINGAASESDFEIKEQILSLSVKKGEVIVRTLYVSIDPYQLNRMKPYSASQAASPFAASIEPGQVIDAYGVGQVVVSGRDDLSKGDIVIGILSWGDYTVIEQGRLLNKFHSVGLPLSYHVGPLGFSGLTAFGGFFEVCKPNKGDKVFVSAASGSVGSIVGQFAKHFGCYVVGCTGNQVKVDLLKDRLGFDEAFNYKDEADLKSALKRYFPDGIDIYFDNVGGEMLEAAVANMNPFGRVAVCGAISEYTGRGKTPCLDTVNIVYKRITLQGFLAADYLKCYDDFISYTVQLLSSGKLEALCDISHGLNTVPSAFVGLFCGDNVGKRIVQIAPQE